MLDELLIKPEPSIMAFHSQNEDSYIHQRMMADSDYGKEDEGIDYSVLSIGVQTLGLILFVEIVKHKLDHAVKGRPFFGTVLHSVYEELSTLGIVELFVYLILKYYKDYDKAQKVVFADVHFALFYTAVLNAFQSVIVAMTTIQMSNSLWVETEHLELDHYVEIREEFDRVKEKLGYGSDDELTSGPSFRNLPRYILQSIRNPGLRGRYMDLLVQVNFHSLRLHFLQGNDLPLTLKVSDYLKRSEERMLTKLVHVSGGAWLMLTGGLNLIYFLMGIVAYVSEDQEVVGLCLTCIFLFMMIVFIFISVGLYFKMRNTFRAIITMKYEMNKMDKEDREAGVRNQLDLFWFREPQFVISIIQFMQFGYALALAIIMMYWTSFTKIEPYYFLAAVVVCYGIFVYVLSMALPQYTLCTSLGYLVDQKNLMETVAAHRLDEARRLQLQRTPDFNFEDDSVLSFETTDTGIHQMRDSLTSEDSGRITPSGLVIDSGRSTDKTQILAELVKSDTSSLRHLLPEESRKSLMSRELRRERRRSVSDGVAMMRGLGHATGDVSGPTLANRKLPQNRSQQLSRAVDDSDILKRDRAERAARRKARKKTMSASDVIQSWTNMTKLDTISDNNSSALGSGSHDVPKSILQQRAERIAQRRQNRSKSKSESAVFPEGHDSTTATISQTEAKSMHEAKPLAKINDHESIPVMEETKSSYVPTDKNLNGNQSAEKLVDSDFHDDVQNDVLTVKTDDSVGALSDVDVQQWEASDLSQHKQDAGKSCSFSGMVKYARDYFSGDPYHTVSHVFGSLIAFFLVGHRVEVMLSTSGAIDPSENTWELQLSTIFWMETVWYAFFIIAGALILLLFLPVQDKSVDQRVVITSALLDILLSGACLAILFLAEAQRCCDSDEIDSDADCCPFWGSRTYGGLGDIEPFTSLIGLRVLRFVAGRFLVEYFDEQSELGLDVDSKKKDASDEHSHHGSTSEDSMQTEVGTPLALWERAISKYPDIVEKYGQFSGELFQSMLGLEVVDGVSHTKEHSKRLLDKWSEAPSSPGEAKHGKKIGRKQSIKLTGAPYTTLPADAQSIIIAGKLGKPVKSMPILRGSSTDLPALAEETVHDIIESQQSSIMPKTIKFEIDDAKVALEEKSQSNFIAPNARLIRRMRRCDRKMLPILTEWGCVDIVITQFEMVYFEALDLKNPSSTTYQEQSSVLAIQATSGGKGHRLRDVAAGRKIVGHINLSEITEMHVERSLPLRDAAHCKDISALYENEDQLAVEFWLESNQSEAQKSCRQVRWENVKEDRLRLVSLHGCLVLRFYSDLDDVELHAETSAIENEAEGPLRKNIAFQWGQTIAYICGKETLQQSLPHFGANNSDELRDLLEVTNHHEKEHELALKNLKSLGISSPTSKEYVSKPMLQRTQSLTSYESMKKQIRKRMPSSTFGDGKSKSTQKEDGVLDDSDIADSIEHSVKEERTTNEISWA